MKHYDIKHFEIREKNDLAGALKGVGVLVAFEFVVFLGILATVYLSWCITP